MDKPKRLERCLEIIKCTEGNKSFLKERKPRPPLGKLILICEYPIAAPFPGEPDEAPIAWKLAKRAARDFLRTSDASAAIVWQRPRAIRVYRRINA